MFLFEVAALGAAATWAIGGLISAKPAAHLGAIGFNCVRMWFVVVFLGIYVFATGTWSTVDSSHASLIFLSGFVGIFMGIHCCSSRSTVWDRVAQPSCFP